MALRQPPAQTSAFLSAQRLNAQKCTGPRTVAGKARSSLNAFKHGRSTHRLLDKLVASGQFGEAAIYSSIRRTYESTFGVECQKDSRQAERFANTAYALGRQAKVFRTKPECPLFSGRLGPQIKPLFRFVVTDPGRRLGLVFWVQRKGFWTMERVMATMFRPGSTSAEPPIGQALETRLRHRAYRMYRPGLWERTAYGLDERGRPDPTHEPQPALQRLLNRFAGRWGLEDSSQEPGVRSQVRSQDSDGVHRTPEIGETEGRKLKDEG